MKMSSRLTILTTAVVTVSMTVALAGCGTAASTSKQGAQTARATKQLPVETQIVKLSAVTGGQLFTGSINPAYTTNLSSRVSGRVASLEVNVGDRVITGQAVAKIDTTTVQQSLDQTKSAAAISQAQYNKAVNDQLNGVANAEKALATQQATYDKTINDQQNSLSAAKQAAALAQSQLNNAIATQQNAIAAAKQGVSSSQASFNSAQASANTAITLAQNNLNATLDNLLSTQDNSLQSYQLALDQAISAYNISSQSGVQKDIDAALSKLQSAQLLLQQAQQSQYKDAQSASSSAQSQLTTLQNALLQAQSSQSVQVAQEALNSALTTLANAQNTAATQTDVSQQQLSQSQIALANAQAAQQTTTSGSKASLDQAEQNLKAAKSTDVVQVSAAQLEQAQTNVKVLSEQLQDGVLLSPIDGIVTAIVTPVGQNAGTQATILSIASIDPIQASVNVSEASIGKVKLGMSMTVNIPTLNKSFAGQVATITPTMDATTKSYVANIKLTDPQHELLPGMFAESSFTDGGRQAIMVPADAVLSQPSGNAIFIVKGGKAQKVLVKIGEITSTFYEITSGLQAGDELVVTGQELLSDQVPVQVMKPGQDGAAGGSSKSSNGGSKGGSGKQNGGQGGTQNNGQKPATGAVTATPKAGAGQ